MSVLLAVMTCSSCSPALLRHWKFFLNQQADYYYIITTDKPCQCPPDVPTLSVGRDSYISGATLPQRMIDAIKRLLEIPWNILILLEYDTLLFRRLPVEQMETDVAAHLAGYQTWNSKANQFFHNPYCFKRDTAIKFVSTGQKLIDDGVCVPRSPECSPDVFFGLTRETLNIPVQINLWQEYSRNSLDRLGHLEEARQAYRDGWSVIHGCKTKNELDYILS